MRLLGQAIRGRWLTDDMKGLAIEAIEKGLKSADDRVQQAALRNLIAMESQNQKDEHMEANEVIARITGILAGQPAAERIECDPPGDDDESD